MKANSKHMLNQNHFLSLLHNSRLIFQNASMEAGHDNVEAQASQASDAKSDVTPEQAKEKINAAIDKSAVQLEVYGNLETGTNESSQTQYRDKTTDWSTGAQARYIPNKTESGLAYTAGVAHKRLSDIRAEGSDINVQKTGDGQFNADIGPDGKVDLIDRSQYTGTLGAEYRVPVTEGVDLFAGVTGSAGVEDVSTQSHKPGEGTTLNEDQRFVAGAEAKLGARANIGPAFLGGSVGVEQELTGDQDTEFKATGSVGLEF